MDKLIVILGPTSSGKSSLAIKLAKKFNGEIISADSRQVYKGMDIGTGKVTKQEQKVIRHHLLDVASPRRQFTVAQYKKLASKAIADVIKRGKFPFLVGGTAFYVYSLIDDLDLPAAKPNSKLRKELEKKTTAQLFSMLKKLDPKRAKAIDADNPVRLIRAIEINKITGKNVPDLKKTTAYDLLILGINPPQSKLYRMIDKRLDQRLKLGMINEGKKLLKSGLSHKNLQSFGLEYRYISKYLRGELDLTQMKTQLQNAIHHFAKRQMTWFKKDGRIHRIKNQKESELFIKKFLQ